MQFKLLGSTFECFWFTLKRRLNRKGESKKPCLKKQTCPFQSCFQLCAHFRSSLPAQAVQQHTRNLQFTAVSMHRFTAGGFNVLFSNTTYYGNKSYLHVFCWEGSVGLLPFSYRHRHCAHLLDNKLCDLVQKLSLQADSLPQIEQLNC